MLLYEIIQTRKNGFAKLLEALSETRHYEAVHILSLTREPQPQSTSFKLFSKGIEKLNACLETPCVIWINTKSPFATISKIHEMQPIDNWQLEIVGVKIWKALEVVLTTALSLNRVFTHVYVFHVHSGLQCSGTLVKLLRENFGYFKILLVSENEFSNLENIDNVYIIQDTFDWGQLTKQCQTRVLSQNVLDQGRPRQLSEFCKSYVYENEDFFQRSLLKGDLLVALLNEEVPVILRSTIPTVKHYVTRRLRSRYYLSTNVFHTKSDNEIFVFSGKKLDIDTLREISSGSTGKLDTALNQLDRTQVTAQFILLKFKTEFTKLCNKVSGKKTIHWIEVDNKRLLWKETVGDMMGSLLTSISDKTEQDQIDEGQIFNILDSNGNNQSIILCDSAGMGKSLLLAKLAYETKKRCTETSLVIFFVMTDFIVSIQKAIDSTGTYYYYIFKICT